jgi:hypothetical protein
MAITGKYGRYVCDTELERESLTDLVNDPEGFECLVKLTPSRFYKYIGGGWQLIGGTVIVTSDTLPSVFTGLAHYFVRINGTEDGYEYFPVVPGAGDLLSANNLSDIANPATALFNLGGQTQDDDLDDIAALNSLTPSVIVSEGAGWVQKTYAQLKTLLALVAADVGLGSVVNLDTSTTANITDSTGKRFMTEAERAKLGFVTITQAVDLDAIESRVNELDASVILKGTFDANASGVFPGAGIAQAGWSYIIIGSDTVIDGVDLKSGDRLIAVTDNASTTTFSGNWFKADYTDAVLSVNGFVGAVTISSISGNAGTATALQTPRNIDGQAFDGTGNITVIAPGTHAATNKATPVDADEFPLADSAAGFVLKRTLWSDIKTGLTTLFNSLYTAKNTAITGATKTKVTYDSKGLVTAGTDATQDDIGDGSTYKQYSATDKTKLAGIAIGATANDTDANLKNTDNHTDGTTNKVFSAVNKTKLGFISITQNVDLDDIETRVNNLDAAVVLKGSWDASAGTFPGSGTAQAGASYIVSVGGTVDSVTFNAGDRIISILDNASTTVFASNWFKADYTDQVLSVNGQTGAVVLTTANVADSTDKRYVTDAQQTVLGNTSGTNSGNETAQSVGNIINGAGAKTTPVNADMFALMDSAAGNIVKKFSWANIVTAITSALASVYATISGATLTSATVNGVVLDATGSASLVLSKAGTYVAVPTPNLSPQLNLQATDYTLADNYAITVPMQYKISGTSFLKLAGNSIFKIS